MSTPATPEGPDWRLSLIVDDPAAIKVAVAFYALPRKHRHDLDRISELSGVHADVRSVLARLDAAGMLENDPPEILMKLISALLAS